MNQKVPSEMEINGYKNVSVTDMCAMMEQGGLRLVDVRTDAEAARGRIFEGESMPLHLLPLRLSGMDKNSTIVFYCQVGGRSARAAALASANGFTNVYNLQGGIMAWVRAGLPIYS